MGPSFNFYKFKDINDALKTKFKETQRHLNKLDFVLDRKFG
jgi:hypothetical protein